jgi:hypothetical protein
MTVPPTGADANEFYWVSTPNVVPLIVTNRQENEIAPVVCRSFIGPLPRATLTGYSPKAKSAFRWPYWFGGRVSEPLLPRRAVERHSLADWALWLPRRAASRCAAHRLPLFRPASCMVLSALPCRCIFC